VAFFFTRFYSPPPPHHCHFTIDLQQHWSINRKIGNRHLPIFAFFVTAAIWAQ
jgi:hypothetical protein